MDLLSSAANLPVQPIPLPVCIAGLEPSPYLVKLSICWGPLPTEPICYGLAQYIPHGDGAQLKGSNKKDGVAPFRPASCSKLLTYQGWPKHIPSPPHVHHGHVRRNHKACPSTVVLQQVRHICTELRTELCANFSSVSTSTHVPPPSTSISTSWKPGSLRPSLPQQSPLNPSLPLSAFSQSYSLLKCFG